MVITRHYAANALSFNERRQLITDLFNSMSGLDILQGLVDDESITEIMVNGPQSVYYEKKETLPFRLTI